MVFSSMAASALRRRRLLGGGLAGRGGGLRGPRLCLRGLLRRLLDDRLVEPGRRPHDDVAALRAGHRALDEKQLALGIDAHHFQAGDRALHVAEMTRHALALEHVRRALVLAGRARNAMRNRVAVRGVLAAEVMALDYAGEALADGHALHVDALADLEDLDADLGAGLEVGELLGPGAKFLQYMARFDARLGEVSGERLDHAARAALAECNLHGGVAVLL